MPVTVDAVMTLLSHESTLAVLQSNRQVGRRLRAKSDPVIASIVADSRCVGWSAALDHLPPLGSGQAVAAESVTQSPLTVDRSQERTQWLPSVSPRYLDALS